MSKINANRQIKIDKIAEIKDKIQNSKSVFVWEYLGLTVSQIEDLKAKLRETNATTKVYKNRLAKLAFEELGHNEISEILNGPSSFAFSTEDEIAPAREIALIAKKFDFVKIKAGILEGKVVTDEAELQKIAELPDRDGLYSMFLGALQGTARKLAYALQAVADKVGESAPTETPAPEAKEEAAPAEEPKAEEAKEEAPPAEEPKAEEAKEEAAPAEGPKAEEAKEEAAPAEEPKAEEKTEAEEQA